MKTKEHIIAEIRRRRDKGSGVFFASAANNPEPKTRLQREIEATDRQIDQLVYELYVIPS